MAKHQVGRSPFKFFALTFVYSWGLWIPAILIGLNDFGNAAYLPLVMVGAFAPLAAALTLVIRRHGWREGRQFVLQAFDFRTNPFYYFLALLIPLAVAALAHFLAPFLNLQVADTLFPDSANPWLMLVSFFFFILFVGGGQEEFGWRGYAQQPLQQRYGVIKASLMIGVVWGMWHLPLWAFGEAQGAYSPVGFVLQTAAVSLVYALLYNASGQKLIIALLFHAMWNAAPPMFPFLHQVEGEPQTGYWVYVGVTVIAGLIAAQIIRRQSEVRQGAEQMDFA